MPGEEAIVAEKRMISHLAQKLDRAYSEMCSYVQVRMAIVIMWSNTLLLRGARDSGNSIQLQPAFEDGA
eukprot:2071965-Ditylum_brightwellii.AAC.1